MMAVAMDSQSVAVMVASAGFVNVRKTQVVVFSICISFGDPLFLYPLQCPPLMRENPWDVASSMANGAIRRDPIAVKAGAISKQGRSTVRCMRYDAHALFDTYQKGGGERRWGEMCPRLGMGMVPKPASTLGISNLLLLQHRPRLGLGLLRWRRRHPNDTHPRRLSGLSGADGPS